MIDPKPKYLAKFTTEELGCIYNCIRETGELLKFGLGIKTAADQSKWQFGERCRLVLGSEIDRRPDRLADRRPWANNPSPDDMSSEAIALLSAAELECFAKAITETLAFLDHEVEFELRVGETMSFARTLRAAIDAELARRGR